MFGFGVLRRDCGRGCDELEGSQVYRHMWLAQRPALA
jgi:hypothetical protein